MIKISEHFLLDEVEYSSTAIAKGIPNRVDPQSGVYAVLHAERILEPLRELMGGTSIRLNSWYRGLALNRVIGGSPRSAHMMARATDLGIKTTAHKEKYGKLSNLYDAILNSDIPYDKVIIEGKRSGSQWIHIQSPLIGAEPRKRKLVAQENSNGEMVFTAVT